jgi:hypothetical protein
MSEPMSDTSHTTPRARGLGGASQTGAMRGVLAAPVSQNLPQQTKTS